MVVSGKINTLVSRNDTGSSSAAFSNAYGLQFPDIHSVVVKSKLAKDCPLVVVFYNATCQHFNNTTMTD